MELKPADAKKMGVTVRTLQHYDREGLLSPSAMSEGGRRLYTDKDIIKLHQIISLKHLGHFQHLYNYIVNLRMLGLKPFGQFGQ